MDTQLSKTCVVYGGVNKTVHVPSVFERGKGWRFRPWEIRFLDCLNRGMDIEEAEKAVQVEAGRSLRLLSSRKAKQYLSERFREHIATSGLTQDWWFSEGKRVWDGVEMKTREQIKVWEVIGKKIVPEVKAPSRDEKSEMPTINININAIQEAERRMKEVEVKSSVIEANG